MTTAKPLGPNAIDPCPSDSCRRWHLSHSIEHDCQVNIPHARRFEDTWPRHVEHVADTPWRRTFGPHLSSVGGDVA